MKMRRMLAGALVATALTGTASATGAAQAAPNTQRSGGSYSFAVIGDIPYGAAQIEAFPRRVDEINADKDVRLVDHLGDIKSGSSLCTDEYFTMIRRQFDRFADPLVYTPGDNEWTDCHRANNGAYNPLERLDVVRSMFFPHPGRTLGRRPAPVRSQTYQGFPENVRYRRARVSFAALHVVGSNNGLAPWTGSNMATPEQAAEVLARTAAAVELVHDTFAEAARAHDRSVVMMMQADMFDPSAADPQYADLYAFTPIVRAIAQESARFRGPVYLMNGDSHVYTSDAPLAAGSRWLAFYGVRTPVENLRRITVDGSTDVADWLKVNIDPRDRNVLTWTRVPFKS